jgi:hypothetical protein
VAATAAQRRPHGDGFVTDVTATSYAPSGCTSVRVIIEVDGDHEAMLTAPDRLAETLFELGSDAPAHGVRSY